MWMQKRGMTWLFRLLSEPRRLWWLLLQIQFALSLLPDQTSDNGLAAQ